MYDVIIIGAGASGLMAAAAALLSDISQSLLRLLLHNEPFYHLQS